MWTDLCDYTPELVDDDVNDEIDDNDSDDDDNGEQCNAEVQACVTDPDCLSCVQNEAVCDSSAAATCSGVMDYLCCVYGDSCSDNALVVAYIGKSWTCEEWISEEWFVSLDIGHT